MKKIYQPSPLLEIYERVDGIPNQQREQGPRQIFERHLKKTIEFTMVQW